jgi:hypothetical protein
MADYEASIDKIKADSHKDIWPWVFLNRIVGFNPNTSRKAGARFTAAKPYFERIKGMDVDDRAGALNDFYQMFKLSLEVAKRLGVRGIVLDLETYNDYNTDTMPVLARMVSTDQATLRARLEQIGSQLATITQQTYPNAIIWCFQTGLGQGPGNGAYQTPFTYIVLGLLQNAARQHMALTLIDGGEPWGYCFVSLGELGQQIQRRRAAYMPLRSEFPNLELAGTVAVWINPNSPARSGFWRSGACGGVGNRGGAGFVPDIIYLTQHYHYVWVYAVADFNPLNAAQAAPFNHALSAALR